MTILSEAEKSVNEASKPMGASSVDTTGDYIPPEPAVTPISEADSNTETDTVVEPALDDLYPDAPTAQGPNTPTIVDPTGAAVTENDSSVANVDTPGTAEANTGVLSEATNVEGQRVDEELARITAQDSPLMARARADAAAYSNRRGLQNSSIAAGATQGAIVDRALPMAQQNAAQNTQLDALEAELGTKVDIFNAEQLNQAESLAAQMRTALEQQDTASYNQAALQFAELQRQAQAQQADIDFAAEQQRAAEQQQYNSQVIDAVSQLNEQYLRGSQAMDLATIQGTYQQIIAANQTAGSLFQEYMNSIGNVMSNPDMTPSQIANAVSNMQQMLESSLRMISTINDMDFGDINSTVPGGSSGSGSEGSGDINPNIYPNFGGYGR